MFCRYCGNQLPDDAKFCNNCGNPVAEPEPVIHEPEPFKEEVPKQEVPKIVEMPKETVPSIDWNAAKQLEHDLHSSSVFGATGYSPSPKFMKYLFIGAVIFIVACVIVGKIAAAMAPAREMTEEEFNQAFEEVTGKTIEEVMTNPESNTDTNIDKPKSTTGIYSLLSEDSVIYNTYGTDNYNKGYGPHFDYDFTIDQVVAECGSNPFAFADKYGGLVLYVSGIVRDLSTTFEGQKYITIESTDDEYHLGFHVTCYIDEEQNKSNLNDLWVGGYVYVCGVVDPDYCETSYVYLKYGTVDISYPATE